MKTWTTFSDALAAGATGYLLKQTPRSELLECIKDVHGGGAPLTGNIARRVVEAFHVTYPASPNRPRCRSANAKCWNCWRAVTFTRKSWRRSK